MNRKQKEVFKKLAEINKIKFVIFVAFIGISLLILFFPEAFGLNKETIVNFVSEQAAWKVISYILIFIILTSFSFSVTIMTLAAVLFFPINHSILYSMIGILGSSLIVYYFSMFFGGDFVETYTNLKKGKLLKFKELVKGNKTKTIFLLSTIFFVPPMIPNSLGGLIKIRVDKYIFATIIGNLPNTIATVYLAHGLVFSNFNEIVLSLVALILISVVFIVIFRVHIKALLKLSL